MGRGEIARRESAIDDRDEVSTGVFIRNPNAALQQRNAERSEIPLADQHHTSLRLFAIATSVDDERGLNISTGRRGVNADSDRGDSGNGSDLLPDLLDICGARFTRLKAAPLGRVVDVQRDAELHDVGGIVAEGHLREPQKAADGGARSGYKKKRERDLRGDENAPAMFCGSSDNANLPAGEHTRGIATREAQCGDKTEEDAAEQRERDGEREDGSVDSDEGFGRKGIRRKQQWKLCQPVRRSHAQDSARAGDYQRFDEQLAHEAPAAGPDSTE